jgi:vacuolar-type H+-ATPase subunit I/STV1
MRGRLLIKLKQALQLFVGTFVYAACIFFVIAVVFGSIFGVIHWAFPSLPIYHGLNLGRVVLAMKVSAWVGFVAATMSCALYLFDIDLKKK